MLNKNLINSLILVSNLVIVNISTAAQIADANARNSHALTKSDLRDLAALEVYLKNTLSDLNRDNTKLGVIIGRNCENRDFRSSCFAHAEILQNNSIGFLAKVVLLARKKTGDKIGAFEDQPAFKAAYGKCLREIESAPILPVLLREHITQNQAGLVTDREREIIAEASAIFQQAYLATSSVPLLSKLKLSLGLQSSRYNVELDKFLANWYQLSNFTVIENNHFQAFDKFEHIICSTCEKAQLVCQCDHVQRPVIPVTRVPESLRRTEYSRYNK
jgi:hypothetical protein